MQPFDIAGDAGKDIENQATEMRYCSGYLAGRRSPNNAAHDLRTDMSTTSLSFRIDVGKNDIEKKNSYKRYQVLKSWVWKECINSKNLNAMKNGRKGYTPLLGICEFCFDTFIFEENRCPSCQRTSGAMGERFNYLGSLIQCEEKLEINPSKLIASDSSFPLLIRLIKALLSFIEVRRTLHQKHFHLLCSYMLSNLTGDSSFMLVLLVVILFKMKIITCVNSRFLFHLRPFNLPGRASEGVLGVKSCRMHLLLGICFRYHSYIFLYFRYKIDGSNTSNHYFILNWGLFA